MMTGGPNWGSEAASSAGSPLGRTTQAPVYRTANAAIIRRVVEGRSIDSGRTNPEAGVRAVYNIASVHLPAVLHGGYLNAYDLASASTSATLGSGGGPAVGIKRRWVDEAVASIATSGGKPANIYYGAMELNGAGMRYYGDMCCVLRADRVTSTSLLLFRNSYDIEREPIRSRIAKSESKRDFEALALSGEWKADRSDMIVCKIMDGGAIAPRLLTTGLISAGILSDEDYLELAREGSFKGVDCEEVRTSASDAAEEAIIADHLATGVLPSMARLVWRNRRRDAERAARRHGLDVRVVTTSGRAR